jgi:hypothetical protein
LLLRRREESKQKILGGEEKPGSSGRSAGYSLLAACKTIHRKEADKAMVELSVM